MQVCPDVNILLLTPVFAASVRLASERTINGSEPPSSRTDFLRYLPAASATYLPAISLPVRVAAFTAGFLITLSTFEEPIIRELKTFSGNPASRNTFSIASAQP